MVSKEEKEMNGDSKVILDAINSVDKRLVKLETTQELHHEQNQRDISGVAQMNRSLTKHCHEIGKLKVHRAIHWVILGAIAAAIILK